MDGKLAEAVLLTAHARVALANIASFTLSLEHKSFAATASLSFESDDGQGGSTQVATSLSGWFEYLQMSGVRGIALSGARIFVVRPEGERVWQQSSDVLQPRPADGRIWTVLYRERERAAKDATPPELALEVSSARLLELLGDCEVLARDGGEAGWARFFGTARSELCAEGEPQRSQLLPARGYSCGAQRLLRACELGWAFGGMGSWNDFEFAESELRRRYSRLTPALYQAVLGGVSAAVNSPLER